MITLLLLAIAAIVYLSAVLRWNVFFVLLSVAAVTGLCAGIEVIQVIDLLKTGMGGTVEKIGLLIILGITLGLLLEKSGATTSVAHAILRLTGQQRAPAAMSGIGYLVGLPIFCDSGFVVLSGIASSMSTRSPGRHVWIMVSLATGLYAVHCLVPPHPGITSAVGTMQVDMGLTMLWGMLVAIVPAVVGYLLGRWMGNKYQLTSETPVSEATVAPSPLPGFWWSIWPILVPVALIGVKSMFDLWGKSNPVLNLLGEPSIAMGVGILLCVPVLWHQKNGNIQDLLEQALAKSGNILLLTAAGGAFGAVIKAMKIGDLYGPALAASGLGLLAPFLLAALLKTAQGSSTVAIMSAASILMPLLPALGFDTAHTRLLALLAMGAGSMAVSHSNDSYFWVISRFGHVPMATLLRTYTLITFAMGVSTLMVLLAMKWAGV